jgi:hypothetical protein
MQGRGKIERRERCCRFKCADPLFALVKVAPKFTTRSTLSEMTIQLTLFHQPQILFEGPRE